MPSLYETLGVEPTATQADIRRAFRRLALENHPDRVGAEGEDRMKTINAAYETLNDPSRRKLYDRFGDATNDILGNPHAMSVVQRVGIKLAMIVIALSFFLMMTGALVSLALVGAKVDGSYAGSWPATFAGVWILDAVLLFWVVFALFIVVIAGIAPLMEIDLRVRLIAGGGGCVVALLLLLHIVFTILGCVKLSQHSKNVKSPISALTAFSPEIAASGLTVLFTLCFFAAPSEEVPISRCARNITRVGDLANSLLTLLFCVLLPLRIDKKVSFSYVLVVIPLVLAAVISIVVGWIRAFALGGLGAVFKMVCLHVIVGGSIIAVMILSALKADGTINSRLVLIFIPLFVYGGIAWILSCCLCCFANCMGAASDEVFGGMDAEGHTDAPEHQPTHSDDDELGLRVPAQEAGGKEPYQPPATPPTHNPELGRKSSKDNISPPQRPEYGACRTQMPPVTTDIEGCD